MLLLSVGFLDGLYVGPDGRSAMPNPNVPNTIITNKIHTCILMECTIQVTIDTPVYCNEC